jgi:2-keto-4-pentenoate hydratase/2-oxohepta-3-ene-1,7-dioic acid hydratase in catechol pathway
VLGPWLVTADEIADPGALDLELRVNGERRQHANTSEMTLGVAELIEMASSFYTLHPGDVVFTGTPAGVSPIDPGDEIVATIQGIGSMRVAVRADAVATAGAVAGASAARG